MRRLRRLELTFPSTTDRVAPAVDRVVRACADVPGGVVRGGLRLRVVVGEAVANAVRHGNLERPFRRVRVTAEARKGEVRVTVEDEGEGYDPGDRPDPTLPGRHRRPDGRGLHLQHLLADEVRHEAEGRRVVLVLREGA